MGAQLVVTYGTPSDVSAFDAYYFGKHVPLAMTIPGLRKYEISAGPVATPEGPAPAHLVALLHFDSMADIGAAFASPEGQATAADLGNFATGGVSMVMFETRTL
jgi:uncharacterized protein (TIGR02118 family)